jgi:DNA-binding transcriptional LysR family regulator
MDQFAEMTSFVNVVDKGRFCVAARQLGISTSSISTHVKMLEDRLGVRLLNRSTRSISLTDVGREYYESCRRILSAIEEADHMAEARCKDPRGMLRLNVSPGISGLIADPIAEFAARYSEASLRVTETVNLVDLAEHNFDLAVRIGPVPDSNLILRRFGAFSLVVCGSPRYFAVHGRPKHPIDLAQHNCLRSYDSPFGDEWLFTGAQGEHRIWPTGNLESNGTDALRWASKTGVGLICVPTPFVRSELDAGELIPVLTEFMPATFSIDALYSDRRYVSAKLRGFLGLLTKHLRATRWCAPPDPSRRNHFAVELIESA